MVKKSPYQILELKDDFTFKDIKKAYRRKVRQFPPEQYPEEFAKIRDAYDFLTNEAYFLKEVEQGVFVYDIEAVLKEDNRIDKIKYLTTVFEMPFEVIKELKND